MFQQSYDKMVLAVVLLALAVSALLLLIRVGAAGSDPGTTGLLAAKAPVKPLDLALVTGLVERLTNPVQVPMSQRRLFVGDLRVAAIPDGAPIPFNAVEHPFTKLPQPAIDFDPDSDADGLSDKLELAQGLDPNDASDAGSDKDGDGYTNSEEITAGTSLSDPASAPEPVAKLRLLRTVINPFKLRFLGVNEMPDGSVRYQLNLRSLDRTYFARLNDEVQGYKVMAFDPKAEGGALITLQQGKETIRLVLGQIVNQEARSAVFVLLLDNKTYRAQIGDDITLRDLTYKVVDIREDRVVLRGGRDAKESVVHLITDDERMRATNPPPAPVPAGEIFP